MRYKPTNDYFFVRIFGQKKNKPLLIDLLSSILPNINIKDLEVNQEVSLEKEIKGDKLGRLDILATLNDGTKIDIEMQVNNYQNTIERSMFYESGLIHQSLKESQDYINLPRVISIWILDYNLFEDGPFHEIIRLKRDYENKILTDKLEFHYIQLKKFKEKYKRISSKLDEWLLFISNDNLEEISMIENEYVKKAEEELETLNGDAYERRLAYLREKAILDDKWIRSVALEEGIAKGENKEKKQTAKKMLEKKLDIELIIEITGLTKEEIEKL